MIGLKENETAFTERPAGLTAVALAFVAYGCVALIYAALLAAGRVGVSSGAWVIGGGLEIMGVWVFVLYSALYTGSALGLLRGNRWAKRLAALLLLWGIVQVTPGISSAVADLRIYAVAREGLEILLRVIALRYLWLESTRDFFEQGLAEQ